MKKNALDNAIRLGQLIRLLTPLGKSSKTFDKRLAKLRSGVDEQVVLAALAVETEQGDRAAGNIEALYQALRGSIVRYLDVKALLKGAPNSWTEGCWPMAGRRVNVQKVLLADAEAVQLESGRGTGIAQPARAGVLHAYTSAVKNSSWMATLIRLDIDLATVNSENANLMKAHSSHQGREGLQATLLKLCPTYAGTVATARRGRSKKPVVKAEGLYVTQVAFNPETLLAQPDIAALANTSVLSAETQPSLAQLLNKAATPVVVGAEETAEAVAQRIVDELVTGLVARKKAIDAEKEALRKKADEAAKASAVDALKQLNPKLLKVLKNNPDLLQSL
ncbi:hypothetical protein WJ97_12915 [Burkholderia ubonensis]|uniref:hypothetical protein n=1 Tax=Burkholderia ubonensis TaxID=101571 RepID=UPI000757FF3C|nr:hypothetical protein [Burkholderia ubonensis]KVP96775.1 hypothetical protein WJ97_12915 [Burkholderia ubonensis]